MTRTQAAAAIRRALLPGLLAAAAAMGAVLLLLLTRAPVYEARVGIVAVPVSGAETAGPEYGSVVSLAMPALPELAVSTPVLQNLADELPEMDRTSLAEAVAVELVPDSAVARITVTSDTPAAASSVLAAVVGAVEGSDLLAPAGTFRVLGDVAAPPRQVRPDPLLAIGLGAAAAVLVGLLVVAAVQLVRPRLLTLPDVEHVVSSVVTKPVPVIALGPGRRRLDLLVAQLAASTPPATTVVAFPAGTADDGGLADAVNERLRERSSSNGRHWTAGSSTTDPALVTVRLRRTSAEQLTAALLQAQESGHQVELVVAS